MIEGYLRALITSMEAKKECLDKLREKTDAQTAILNAEKMDWDAFDALVDEKDVLIDELDKLDDGFQTVFERIKDELQTDKDKYKSSIAKIQEQIKHLTEQKEQIPSIPQHPQTTVQYLPYILLYFPRYTNLRQKSIHCRNLL